MRIQINLSKLKKGVQIYAWYHCFWVDYYIRRSRKHQKYLRIILLISKTIGVSLLQARDVYTAHEQAFETFFEEIDLTKGGSKKEYLRIQANIEKIVTQENF